MRIESTFGSQLLPTLGLEPLEECLKQWFQKKELKEYRAIPCHILLGIWLVRNAHLFENRRVPTFQVFAQVFAIFQGSEMDSKEREFQNRLENCRLTNPFLGIL